MAAGSQYIRAEAGWHCRLRLQAFRIGEGVTGTADGEKDNVLNTSSVATFN